MIKLEKFMCQQFYYYGNISTFATITVVDLTPFGVTTIIIQKSVKENLDPSSKADNKFPVHKSLKDYIHCLSGLL